MALMALLCIILIIGVLTTLTDLKNKKIYNNHLAIGAILGLIAITYLAVFKHENILFHITNGLVAFLIGALLHRSALWRGGDAKLFTLYAFLMPTPTYNYTLFPSVVSLFGCSFIAGTIILLPVFIKDIITHHNAIANDLLLPAKRRAIFDATGALIMSSWILFPLYYLAEVKDPFIMLTISYLFFNWGYSIKKEIKGDSIIKFLKKRILRLSIFFTFGLFMRLWLSPNSLSFLALTKYTIMIILFTTLSICIHTTFNHFKDYQERVSFAPLLFIGCLLSYTPLLTKLTHILLQWNAY
jgi:Flp pilus assembly protein protease CpaA